MKLLELKREIITIKAFNQKMDFELKVTDDNTGIDYVDDDCLVTNGAQVVIKRIPPVGVGLLARLSAVTTAVATTSAIPIDSQDPNNSIDQQKNSVATTEFVQSNDDDNDKLDESHVEDDTIIEAAVDMYVYLHYITKSFHADVHIFLHFTPFSSIFHITYLSIYIA